MPEQFDLVIRGGTVVTESTQAVADIGIHGASIAAISDGLRGSREIDATGKLVLPGGIDAHVHLTPSEDMLAGPRWCDDFFSGTRAAAAGGITAVGNMTFPRTGETLRQAITREATEAREQAVVDVFLHPVLTDPSMQPLTDIPALASEGHTSLKLFMSFAGFTHSPEPYLHAMHLARDAGMLTLIHCEDAAILAYSLDRLIREGKRDIAHYPASRPVAAEVSATARAVAFAETTGAPSYVVHLSCAEALAEVRKGRARGVPVWVETRPLYLHLTKERFGEPDGAKYVGQPPLRSRSDVAALWHGLAMGDIHTVGTDHAPWLLADKVFPGVTIETVRPGVADLETVLPMLFSEGVVAGRLTLSRFAAVTSTNAAKLFGLFPRKGTIAPGSDADLAIWDPQLTESVNAASFVSRCDYSPYEGWPVTGWPIMTISRGEIVFEGGAASTAAGRGQVLRRGRTQAL